MDLRDLWPFYSDEKKAEINSALQKNHGRKAGEIKVPLIDALNPFYSQEEKDQINTALFNNYGYQGRDLRQEPAPLPQKPQKATEPQKSAGSAAFNAAVENLPPLKPKRNLRSDPMPDPPGANNTDYAQDLRQGPSPLPPGSVAPSEPPGEPTLEEKPNTPPSTPGTRTNIHGVKQNGVTLGGINKIFEGTGYSFADSNELYKTGEKEQQIALSPQAFDINKGLVIPGLTDKYRSEALPTTDAQTEQLAMDPSLWTKDHGLTKPGSVTRNHELTHSLFQEAPSAAGTTGRNQDDPTEGVARSGDLSDRSRAIHFDHDTEDERFSNFGADYGDDDEYTSPMYENHNRNTFRNAFLDDNVSSARAIRNAYATQGVYSGPEGVYQRQGDDIVKVDSDKAYAFMNEVANGRNPAEKFKDGYVAGLKEELAEDDEPETPKPTKPTKEFETTIS